MNIHWNLDAPQAIIISCTSVAAWLISRKDDQRKWGFVIGLAGQPFWFWSTLSANPVQAGVLAVSLFWTYCYTRGIYNHFALDKLKRRLANGSINQNSIQVCPAQKPADNHSGQ